MANLIWSIVLAAIGITGLWLAGSQRRAGWALGLAVQVLWLVFGIVSGQYGFIASALAYGFVYARNYLRARRPRRLSVRITADTSRYVAAISRAHAARALQWRVDRRGLIDRSDCS